MGPYALGTARPEWRRLPLAGGCATEPRAEHSWTVPRGASGCMAGGVAPPREGEGSSPSGNGSPGAAASGPAFAGAIPTCPRNETLGA